MSISPLSSYYLQKKFNEFHQLEQYNINLFWKYLLCNNSFQYCEIKMFTKNLKLKICNTDRFF